MKYKQIAIIIAIILILITFGMSHSLKKNAEIVNLVVMGIALLFLIIMLLKGKNKEKDS